MSGWVGEWVVGEVENIAISAFNKVGVEVEAELGNIESFIDQHKAEH